MGSSSERDHAKLQSLKARVAKCRADRVAQTEKFDHLARQRKEEREAARIRARSLAHRIPSEDALRLVLPARAAALRARSGGPPPATGVSEHVPDADRVTISGLTFFVPREIRAPGKLADRVLNGWLPLREIAEARDVAVGAIMLDIGANIGTTMIPRIALGDFTWAFAAEAEAANATCLRHAVTANALHDRIVVDHVAIAGHDGEIELAVSTQIGTHRVILDGDRPRGTIAVPCRRLDTWVRERAIDLALTTFIKCDVEGAEMSVLQGAPDVLQRRHIAWQIEFSPAALAKQGAQPTALLDVVSAHFGYFIDLHGDGSRARCRPTSELAEAVGYVGTADHANYTNLLLFNGPSTNTDIADDRETQMYR